MTLKYYSNVDCPECGYKNTVKIPESMWLNWIECKNCNNKIIGKKNHHGWNWVFCTYGDVPWLSIQEQENKEN